MSESQKLLYTFEEARGIANISRAMLRKLARTGQMGLAVLADSDAEVLTIKEAAVLLRCSKAHVQNLLAGKVKGAPALPYIPVGRRKLIRRASLSRWMEQAENQC